MLRTTPTGSSASLVIHNNTFTVWCEHGYRQIRRTNDTTIPETDEFMIRYALQRHVDRCDRGCTVPLWLEWFERRRRRFVAEGNSNAHG